MPGEEFVVPLGQSASVRSKYFRINSLIIVCLFALSMISILILESTDNRVLKFFAWRFNHDVEQSVPTIYNYFLLVSNFGLLTYVFLIKRTQKDSDSVYWLILAVVMFLMGYDEAAQVHEKFTQPMRSILPESPLWHFSWTPIGAFFALVVGGFYLPFLMRLPKAVASLMALAGATYLFGALMVETLGGWVDFYNDDRGWRFFLLATIEESFEMLGMVIFGYALLRQISFLQNDDNPASA
ncbi:hypothetical protein [Ruegeria sp. HKCCA5491]|uniref:hypothetical protein n=1 Tax=Ruegeria sp. HKCCA5491 TaxID=2682986 RepID=UPI001489B56C|nr:hypothetical protein [Ruegeria sp. HKCCA5491]